MAHKPKLVDLVGVALFAFVSITIIIVALIKCLLVSPSHLSEMQPWINLIVIVLCLWSPSPTKRLQRLKRRDSKTSGGIPGLTPSPVYSSDSSAGSSPTRDTP